MNLLNRVSACAGLLAVVVGGLPLAAQSDFERPPIAYGESFPDNPIQRLQARLDRGESRLAYEETFGYLRSVLAELSVPIASQTLVFSKTSLQQQRISPQNPRALYFSDSVYVGYVRAGEVMELSVADPQLGAVFYTLEQAETDRPRFVRQTDDCLICHGGSQTRGVPGHIVRSVYPDKSGRPIFSAGSYRVDHTTPFKQRWGGWYATGTHGSEPHLGNITYRERPAEGMADDTTGLNVEDVTERFNESGYLSPHSDLVALMVLTHQVFAHNVITQASFDTRLALHREASLNRELGEPEGHRWPSTDTILESAAARLVECFLFCEEAPLSSPIKGSTGFAGQFAAIGPADPQGRSLRTFDLETRMFRYPCSFLIHSESFDALPGELLDRFWGRMNAVLSGTDATGKFDHLTAGDRSAIREILVATKDGAASRLKKP